MKRIDIHKFIITIIFFIMSFLNIIGFIHIETYAVFGMTFGSLLICISTCFEGRNLIYKKLNLDIFKLVKNIFYILGWIFIIIGAYLKSNYIFDEMIEVFNSDTLMLLSLGFTFLSLIIGDINQKKEKERIDKQSKELDNLLEIQEKQKAHLEKLIDDIKK